MFIRVQGSPEIMPFLCFGLTGKSLHKKKKKEKKKRTEEKGSIN